MIFNLWTGNGALNSTEVFRAFEQGVGYLGHRCVFNDIAGCSDVDVIWSMLFSGRMKANRDVWEKAQQQARPVIVLEVGSIHRGVTWKVAINGVNRDAHFGPANNTSRRSDQMGLVLRPWRDSGDHILICTQNTHSYQWRNMPPISEWVQSIVQEIRQVSGRRIIIRQHPRDRSMITLAKGNKVYLQLPEKVTGTYDDYDMPFAQTWATVSWSSNPGIHSILHGIPAYTGPASLAHDVSFHNLRTIESPIMPDRQQWLNDYAWTEYTVQEISQGLPLSRILPHLLRLIS